MYWSRSAMKNRLSRGVAGFLLSRGGDPPLLFPVDSLSTGCRRRWETPAPARFHG